MKKVLALFTSVPLLLVEGDRESLGGKIGIAGLYFLEGFAVS